MPLNSVLFQKDWVREKHARVRFSRRFSRRFGTSWENCFEFQKFGSTHMFTKIFLYRKNSLRLLKLRTFLLQLLHNQVWPCNCFLELKCSLFIFLISVVVMMCKGKADWFLFPCSWDLLKVLKFILISSQIEMTI